MSRTVGVATLLSGEEKLEVLTYWNMFEIDFNSTGVQSFDSPNFGYQGGTCEDAASLKKDLEQLWAAHPSFEVNVDGFGYFEEPSPVVYLKIEKNERLAALHKDVHQLLEQHCENLFALYAPDQWVPHITLAMGDISPEDIQIFKKEYHNHAPAFTQKVDHLALVEFKKDGRVELL
ncbi:hypothetical protein GCM10010954_30390 [Halobacillus andaensis]|uniref:2'-5' RNA ligase family protein n=1 Tax=Halobacillus andaensis TaxID=1176239 RepID=A0A917EY19_HALAA|nr:2'-5' RNA ligase family protein [Halobacillus andaensis]MBP2005144.1 2'-5' RNA ligase [Halobacillus andaensis]GGF29162.1 hypothetical protein GCM10010954_30390 [Halobacillus andaensis]